MPNYYFTDSDGIKQGPITEERLRTLAERGVITANTPLETEGGHKGFAAQIRERFPKSGEQSIALNLTSCHNRFFHERIRYDFHATS